jgi:hypothetical protein
VLLALLGILAAFLLAFFGLGAFLPVGPFGFWVGMAIAAIPLAYVAVRLALVLPIAVLAEPGPGATFARPWQLARGQTFAFAAILGLGVLGPALALGWLSSWLDSASIGLLAWPVRTAATVAVAGFQAVVLSEVGLQALNMPLLNLRESATGHRLLRLGLVAALLLPTLVANGFTTSGFPSVSASDPQVPIWSVRAVAWPRRHFPVVVSGQTIYDCLDADCHRVNTTNLGGFTESAITIGSDGAVYAELGAQAGVAHSGRS